MNLTIQKRPSLCMCMANQWWLLIKPYVFVDILSMSPLPPPFDAAHNCVVDRCAPISLWLNLGCVCCGFPPHALPSAMQNRSQTILERLSTPPPSLSFLPQLDFLFCVRLLSSAHHWLLVGLCVIRGCALSFELTAKRSSPDHHFLQHHVHHGD